MGPEKGFQRQEEYMAGSRQHFPFGNTQLWTLSALRDRAVLAKTQHPCLQMFKMAEYFNLIKLLGRGSWCFFFASLQRGQDPPFCLVGTELPRECVMPTLHLNLSVVPCYPQVIQAQDGLQALYEAGCLLTRLQLHPACALQAHLVMSSL